MRSGFADAADFVTSFNHWMANSAVWVLVIGAIVIFFDVRRIVRIGSVGRTG